jgi:hypothetical protein
MKNIGETPKIEPRTLALLLGFALGLGLAVHELFFVLGAIVAIAAAGEHMLHAARKHLNATKPVHRHS